MTELRTIVRALARAPGFLLLAIAILTTGIALTLYMFGAIDGFVLRPLPYNNADRMIHLELTGPQGDSAVSIGDYFELRDAATTVPDLAAFYDATVNLGGVGEPERLEGEFVSANLFDDLGVRPDFGRGFDPGDERAGAERVALISNELWQRRFGRDPAVLGKNVRLNSEPTTIVGVMAPGFDFPQKQEVWIPLRRDSEAFDRAKAGEAEVAGHLAPGATLAAARAELQGLVQRLAAADSSFPSDQRAVVKPFPLEFVSPRTRTALSVMLISVVLVLLIACADVANLLLLRGLGRQRAIAVRAALGASRRRLVVLGLVEGGLIAGVASGLGLAVAEWGGAATMRLLRGSEDMEIPSWVHIRIDGLSIAVTLGVAVAVTLIAALGPALAGSRPNVLAELRGARGSIGRLSRSSRVLVSAQIALAVALVASAGLGARSFQVLSHQKLGVDGDRILGARLGLFEGRYPTDASRLAFFRQAEERLRALPGVLDATVASSLPSTFVGGRPLEVEGVAVQDFGGRRGDIVRVSPSYCSTLDLPILSGRGLTAGDDSGGERVAVVNQRLVHDFFRDANPIGRRIRFAVRNGETPEPWRRIVGVVPDVYQGHVEDGMRPVFYVPLAQDVQRFAFVAVRTADDPRPLGPAISRAIAALDPDQPVYWIRTVSDWVAIGSFGSRFLASLFSIFAGAGLLLATVGVYSVVGYTVASRTSEIGVRRALGAPDSGVVGWILRGSARDLAIGLAVGSLLAAALMGPVAGIFHGVVRAFDPATWIALPLVLAAATALACLGPALRALQIDPAAALRVD